MPSTIPTSIVFVSVVAIVLLFLLGQAWPWIKHRLFVHHEDTQGLILQILSELIVAVKSQTATIGSDTSTAKLYLGTGFDRVCEDLGGMGRSLIDLIASVKEQTLWMKASPPVDENVEITLGVLQEIRDSVAELDKMSRIENPTEREIHTNIDELRAQLAKQHDSGVAGLASIASKLEQSIKVQKAFLATIYGQDGSGYSAMDEGEQQIRETAERFRKVYGVSWEDAMERARNAAAVQSGPGMRDGV